MKIKIKNSEVRVAVMQIEKEIQLALKQMKTKSAKKEFKREAYKKFDEIYEKYGQQSYIKYVPKKYRKMDISKLIEDGKFLDIYYKHGEKIYNLYIDSAKEADIQNEVGSGLKEALHLFKKVIKKGFAPILLSMGIALPIYNIGKSEAKQYKEEIQYASEIEEYTNEINEYAEEVKSYNLTDIQNIMKVIDDMWKNIYGYGDPELDLTSYAGIDLSEEYGVGVCRNMADDVSRKLNAINPEYDAKNVVVYCKKGNYNFSDINRKFPTDQQLKRRKYRRAIAKNPEHIPSEKLYLSIDIPIITGNHEVVFMKVPNENIELVIDPTNPGIGVYNNGKITMFNSTESNPAELYVTILGTTNLGLDETLHLSENYIKSIGFIDLDKLDEIYGVSAQNTALREVREIAQKQELVEKFDLGSYVGIKSMEAKQYDNIVSSEEKGEKTSDEPEK